MTIKGKEYPDYDTYLHSPEWQQLRQERLETDHHRCVCCGAKDNLQVHHLNYKFMDDISYLVTLCRDCHKRLHKEILPGLAEDIAKLGKKFTPGLVKFRREYEQERNAVYLSWFQKLAVNGKWADKGRAVRTITIADIKGAYSVTVVFESLTNMVLSGTGSGTIADDTASRVSWK